MNPYKVTKQAMNEIDSRTQEKIRQLFSNEIPDEIAKRLSRERRVLQSTPYTYALLIADSIIKEFEHYNLSADLGGDWTCSYYAWLLELTSEDPIREAAKYRCYFGLEMKKMIRDRCFESPVEIYVSPKWMRGACVELPDKYAKEWGFWICECPNGKWKLINECFRENDIYAARAPVIQIIDS